MASVELPEHLLALGVSSDLLTEQEKASLDERGYVIFVGLMDQDWVERLRQSYERIMTEEGDQAGAADNNLEPGTRRPSNLVNRGEEFDGIYTHPKVLAAVYHVLQRGMKLSNYCGRDALPGMGQQHFHSDWPKKMEAGEPFHTVNTAWMLDDFSERNGATRVIPGSHKWIDATREQFGLTDPFDRHPDQIIVDAPAGSVLVFNAHTWHSGTQNRSDSTRRGIFAHFVAEEHDTHVNHRAFITEETLQRIPPAAQRLLGL